MDSILMFDDSPPPTDDIIDMMADASMESFLGLNDSFMFDMDNTTALDQLLESYTDLDTDFGDFSFNQNLSYPSLSTLGQKETTMFEFITVGIMLTMVSMFGLAGNIVAIIVLSSPVMRGSFSSLLIGKVFKINSAWFNLIFYRTIFIRLSLPCRWHRNLWASSAFGLLPQKGPSLCRSNLLWFRTHWSSWFRVYHNVSHHWTLLCHCPSFEAFFKQKIASHHPNDTLCPLQHP